MIEQGMLCVRSLNMNFLKRLRSEPVTAPKLYEREEFEHFKDHESGAVFENMEFRRCNFIDCSISITYNPQNRSTIRNVQLVKCEVVGGSLYPAIVEEVLVDGLGTAGLLQAWGAAFKHVTLRGKIGRIMITNGLFPSLEVTSDMQRRLAAANAAYYADVDWALDISEAEFQEFDLRGLPSRLVRRDPETQVVVTRAKALQGEWKKLDLSNTYWDTAIEFMLQRGDEDVVLVAPKRDRHFAELLHGLHLLRQAGVAEPD